ncbi:ATP-grasp domain-containing protein [Rubritalea squalenifaciens]|uniref:ATP-grasp domain-containing protein n=1 Tax=Rubritalea squalenifaciens TaxID=407226 RepID=UPI0013564B90|nr:ATP-grasp domain-containing protein [Rubritalea squalenifaciens]
MKHHKVGDFLEIAQRVRGKCTDVVPYVMTSKSFWAKKWWWALRPSFYAATRCFPKLKPVRGAFFHGACLTKEQQYEELDKAGVETLKWSPLTKTTVLDPAEWGDFLVIKPEGGKRGRGVKVVKTRKVKWKEEMQDGERLVIQQFAYTGSEPTSYRVLTFFGRPLFCMKSVNVACGNKLEQVESTKDFAGHNIVATAREGETTLAKDEEVMAFASRVTEVFADIPVLGIDVIRDVRTGKLFCVEVNPYGQTWHFSSELGIQLQEKIGQAFEEQFGAFDIAAEVLIEKARAMAK